MAIIFIKQYLEITIDYLSFSSISVIDIKSHELDSNRPVISLAFDHNFILSLFDIKSSSSDLSLKRNPFIKTDIIDFTNVHNSFLEYENYYEYYMIKNNLTHQDIFRENYFKEKFLDTIELLSSQYLKENVKNFGYFKSNSYKYFHGTIPFYFSNKLHNFSEYSEYSINSQSEVKE